MLSPLLLEDALRTIRSTGKPSFSVIPVSRGSHVPRYNVMIDEAANTATYSIALPGYVKSDLEIRYDGSDMLSVSSTVYDKDTSGYVVRMFSRRPFHLSWNVGDVTVSSATMSDGVLQVTLLRNANSSGDLVPID